jgi:thioredoxin reductase
MDFEVIIIGGSYAGLSAGLALGRALRKVLIIDNHKPCNAQTPYSHNFLTHDGKKPDEIAAAAKAEVLKYASVSFLDGEVIAAHKNGDLFKVKTAQGEEFTARRILLSAGLKDVMPDIKNFAKCWGISVIHCPYCHGYEVRGERIALMMNGEMAFEMAKMLHHWNKDLTLLTNGKSTLTQEQTQKLQANSISIIEDEIVEIEEENGQLSHIVFKTLPKLSLKALYARPALVQHANVYQDLGCELTETGIIKVNEQYQTTVSGVYAAGDCASALRGLSTVTAAGTVAAVMMNREMITEDF